MSNKEAAEDADTNPSERCSDPAKLVCEKSAETTCDDERQHESPVDVAKPPYSIYSTTEIWFIVTMVAIAGLFSPLPANIYFPAIPTLVKVFHKSTELLNVTVTVYLVMQGVSPMIWGPLSDQFGRRPVFLLCLIVLLLSCLGLALTPTSAFWLLMLMRCLQSAGGASTIALGAGAIGDISEPAKRGGYFAMFNIGPMLAPCIGPAVGGALSEKMGWRSIFWFLVIGTAICFILVLCFLPETMRAIVGNGSVKPTTLYRPLLPIVGKGRQTRPWNSIAKRQKGLSNPFILFIYPDVIISLAFTGVVYAVNYAVTATISSSFATVYPYLSEIDIGLCYLSTGGGMLIGSTMTGKLLDRDYRVFERKFAATTAAAAAAAASADAEEETEATMADFPIEVARLRTMPLHLGAFIASLIAWGWCLDKKVSIASVLVLQVILGWASIAILNTTMTLMIDIMQSKSSSVTACINLVRCSLAAVLISVIDKMTTAMGFGWAYTTLGCICVLLLPLMLLEMKVGPRFRLKRKLAEEAALEVSLSIPSVDSSINR